ncbi:hypothetical protein [Bradyrhizobium glycinis]|uniref:hypothetical protein n=1 Tax=Bradyrhizobium glycinis TaxID=2751812 RepID=UPI0018D6B8E9|nr:hypothetical protein [Bradyrhizobium glycinis]MBH5367175.1 hypothetical protein [Bradyrhizobium glycinis]
MKTIFTTTKAAARGAAVFLNPPHASESDRADALATAASLMRQAVEQCIRAGRDDLAFRSLDIALEAEQ